MQEKQPLPSHAQDRREDLKEHFHPSQTGPESSMNSRADKNQPGLGKQGWGCLRIANNDLILEIS